MLARLPAALRSLRLESGAIAAAAGSFTMQLCGRNCPQQLQPPHLEQELLAYALESLLRWHVIGQLMCILARATRTCCGSQLQHCGTACPLLASAVCSGTHMQEGLHFSGKETTHHCKLFVCCYGCTQALPTMQPWRSPCSCSRRLPRCQPCR
jgi:hypothetical protein